MLLKFFTIVGMLIWLAVLTHAAIKLRGRLEALEGQRVTTFNRELAPGALDLSPFGGSIDCQPLHGYCTAITPAARH